MKTFYLPLAASVLALGVSACTTVLKPSYIVSDPEVMQISSKRPVAKPAELVNLGQFCVSVQGQWKADGETPDGQTIWTKDTYRKAAACR